MTLRQMEGKYLPAIHAVIGVWYRNGRTYYVERSHKMAHYPGVWSLFSIQFSQSELTHCEDLATVQRLMDRMSDERLGGAAIVVKRHLISGNSDQNPIKKHVYLHLYQIDLVCDPVLNPEFYTQGAWLTAKEYEERSAGQPCGLCLRLWSDHSWLMGLTDRPFVPRTVATL